MQSLPAGAEIFVIGEESAITQLDAEKHELVGEIAANSSELVALTLWLLAERAKGAQSQWSSLLASLPVRSPASLSELS
jgi:histone-lysine N-methyltransferase SETD3